MNCVRCARFGVWCIAGVSILALPPVRGLLVADDQPQGRLLFLGVAYDEGPPEGHGVDHFNFAADNFSRLFRQQSRPLFQRVEVESLEGNDATLERVGAALAGLRREARPTDLAVLYWGTHGATGQNGWSANLPGGTVIFGRDIKSVLAEMPCPVLCIFSTCGSGGFASGENDGVPLPENVVAFCACRSRQTTTNELDRALCEALAGFADADQNGTITLGEAVAYVPRRYRQIFKGGDPANDQLPVISHSDPALLDRPLTTVNGTHAAVVYDDVWYGVTVLEQNGETSKVRFLGYDSTTTNGGFSFPDAEVSGEVIDFPGGEEPIDVEQNGTWYAARVIERNGRQWRIDYIGYDEEETVPRSRVRFPFSNPGNRNRE